MAGSPTAYLMSRAKEFRARAGTLTQAMWCPSELLVPDILSRPAALLRDASERVTENRMNSLHTTQLRREKHRLEYFAGDLDKF